MTEFGTFRDERDGYVYKTVKIGSQVCPPILTVRYSLPSLSSVKVPVSM